MDNDHDMKVSVEELKTVLSTSPQGRSKMNSTLFRNLVEKSERVSLYFGLGLQSSIGVIVWLCLIMNWLDQDFQTKISNNFSSQGYWRLCAVWTRAHWCLWECWEHSRIHAGILASCRRYQAMCIWSLISLHLILIFGGPDPTIVLPLISPKSLWQPEYGLLTKFKLGLGFSVDITIWCHLFLHKFWRILWWSILLDHTEVWKKL